jgi:shikimate kinase
MRVEKLILIGPMGSGKSTIGTILARELQWQYFDNDTELSNSLVCQLRNLANCQ